ncbi:MULTISPECIES: hypothetical protein [Halorubrum]|uniref:hypothetical protein n=1 Tax=Halorubrum TaxID=56688 RepID=UPI00097FA38E|nr:MULTISPECIES: hypothetical protein [Halorubrum]TKX43860.1 hypothetical protein EXE50_08680 [Halorubrum sp. ARQ200]
MYAETTRGLETPVRDAASTLTDEYPAALATLVRADRASHDVAQTTLREFRGEDELLKQAVRGAISNSEEANYKAIVDSHKGGAGGRAFQPLLTEGTNTRNGIPTYFTFLEVSS